MKKVVSKSIQVKKYTVSLDGDLDRFVSLHLAQADPFEHVYIYFEYAEKPLNPRYNFDPKTKTVNMRLPAQNFPAYFDLLKTVKPIFAYFIYDVLPENDLAILQFRLTSSEEPVAFRELAPKEMEEAVM